MNASRYDEKWRSVWEARASNPEALALSSARNAGEATNACDAAQSMRYARSVELLKDYQDVRTAKYGRW